MLRPGKTKPCSALSKFSDLPWIVEVHFDTVENTLNAEQIWLDVIYRRSLIDRYILRPTV